MLRQHQHQQQQLGPVVQEAVTGLAPAVSQTPSALALTGCGRVLAAAVEACCRTGALSGAAVEIGYSR